MTLTSASRGARAPQGAPRALRVAGPAILVVAALVVLAAGLAFGGGAAPLAIGDSGPLVRWGLPVARAVVNIAAAGMAGSLVLALFALKPAARSRADAGPGPAPFETALDTASASAAVFTIAAAATGFLTFLDAFDPQLGLGPEFGAQLGRFLTEVELGRTWLITAIAGAALTVLAFAVRTWTPALLVALIAVAALVPMATQGHSGELASHNAAVGALVVHTIGAALWIGGLLLVVIVRPRLGRDETATLLARYSTIALFSFVIVAGSGLVRSVIALQTPEALLSAYGGLLIVKVVALVALGVLGAWYRGRFIGRMRDSSLRQARELSPRFWSLIAVELAIMGAASGAAVALSRTSPPVAEQPPAAPTPAELLTGAPLPPELTPDRWITSWSIDPLWFTVAAFGAFFYVAGVWRLRRRGDAWPAYRTVLWLGGLALLVWVTCGAVNVYQDYLFSVHMMGHMLLTMAIPVMLVPGTPVTLAARAIRKRDDGTRGGREWILWAVHTPFARVVTNPWVTAALFIGSLWAFYYTDLFRWSLYDHLGHEWMVAHFLITGYLFVQSLVGIDPVPYRLPHAFRLVLLIAVMAMHAFFGIAIMMQSGLMAAEWFGAMGRTWGAAPLEDQYVGGGMAWSIGELPTLVLAVTVAIQWSRSDERMQRRRDRHADRTGDVDLAEYNAYLAGLAAKQPRIPR
ncbi:MAG: cytochrome c oxidase assembly protein [Microbacterium sp.]|uniref:cytochrome c oxidase assembly protein n=1 Tax=Microbacterium sp. TaxID=51671 RepID=UPI0039E699BA